MSEDGIIIIQDKLHPRWMALQIFPVEHWVGAHESNCSKYHKFSKYQQYYEVNVISGTVRLQMGAHPG